MTKRELYESLSRAVQSAQPEAIIESHSGVDLTPDGATPTGHIYNLPVATPDGVPLNDAAIIAAIGQWLADRGVKVLVGSDPHHTFSVESVGGREIYHQLYLQRGIPRLFHPRGLTQPNVGGVFADGCGVYEVAKEGDTYVARQGHWEGELCWGLKVLPASNNED